ncbi:putative fad binding domain protein [Botrytis fragariae]|uniref:Putative fad binding domain protein n=1 Tax=Botrytis fragariae TaxID=1964551 RepID=A0A8H6APY0_9HELO|nr:putative fad binding domain protein [Botrytis fragariae]KAF5871437.1 putative fad binding domain protein [Botrytis fragariae]
MPLSSSFSLLFWRVRLSAFDVISAISAFRSNSAEHNEFLRLLREINEELADSHSVFSTFTPNKRHAPRPENLRWYENTYSGPKKTLSTELPSSRPASPNEGKEPQDRTTESHENDVRSYKYLQKLSEGLTSWGYPHSATPSIDSDDPESARHLRLSTLSVSTFTSNQSGDFVTRFPSGPFSSFYTILVLAPDKSYIDRESKFILTSDTAVQVELECIELALSDVIKRWRGLDDPFRELLEGNFLDIEQYSSLLFDDEKFTRSRKYFWAIGLLTEIDNILSDNIKQWGLYYQGRLQPLLDDRDIIHRFDSGCLYPPAVWETNRGDNMLKQLKKTIQQVQTHINTLKELRNDFSRKLETTKALRDGLFNAIALIESRASTRLGENVKLLTYVSIFYLPLAFCAVLWAIPNIQEISTKVPFIITAFIVGAITYAIVLNIEFISQKIDANYNPHRQRLVDHMQKDSSVWSQETGKRFEVFKPTSENNPIFPEITRISKTLAAALPESVILPQSITTFNKAVNGYWAKQECEVNPSCIVRPRNDEELCTAVTIIKREYDERMKKKVSGEHKSEGLFAVRSGGHSCVAGAASIEGGVLIDLSCFNEVIPSEGNDEASVIIGAGCRWMDVSKVLDEMGVAVVGGRNSAVGVGGLTLGGGLSFFCPQFGLVCSNIISYDIVLASGTLTTASATQNPDLWCALKGGSNNFGIVTRFKARSFPSTKIWSGFLYMPSSQTSKVISAFHEVVNRVDWDHHAAGPLACFTYIQPLGIQAISVNLVYTKPSENRWPEYWKISPFSSMRRFWSTCKLRTLTSTTDEMNALNPPGKRQVLATTTIKNEFATLTATHAVYQDAISSLRGVKGLVWTLVMQPLLPDWVRKGCANPLGLHNTNEPLVIVSFTVNWPNNRHDEVVKKTTRRAIEEIEHIAKKNGTGHKWKYLNYCAEWQRPFDGYGEENVNFLRDVSRAYDSEGLFQRGCVGGFKLRLPVDGEIKR